MYFYNDDDTILLKLMSIFPTILIRASQFLGLCFLTNICLCLQEKSVNDWASDLNSHFSEVEDMELFLV